MQQGTKRKERQPAAAKVATDARERLLDTAERLFAQCGYNGVSLRTITEEADVNVGAAHYYFGSKEELLRAVFERRVTPLNKERHRLLDQVVAKSGDGKPKAVDVIAAFIAPTFQIAGSGATAMFSLLSGRCSIDPTPEVKRIRFDFFDAVAARFVELLHRSHPELTKQELFWRLACIYGAMVYVRSDNGRLQQLFGKDFDMSDSEQAIAHVIPFLVEGFLRPSESNRAPESTVLARRKSK